MVMLGEAIVKIRTDDSEVEKGVDKTKSMMKSLGDTAKSALGAGIAVGFDALIKGAGDAVNAASNMNETLSKSNAIFKDSAGEIAKWASGGSKDFGMSKAAALEAASGFGNMFDQLGIGSEQAAGMSMGMVELAADFASFNNVGTEEVLNAQSAAFRGEYDSLQKFLPLINAASVEQRALEMTGKKTTKELTAQEKALAVNALMFEGAGKAAGDYDKTSGSLANRQKQLNADFQDMQVKIGSVLLPVIVALASFLVNELLPALSEISKAIGPTLSAAIDLVAKSFDVLKEPLMWLEENREVAIGAISALAIVISSFLVPAIIAWTVAEWAKVAALIAGAAAFLIANAPIIAIGVAIGLLIAGILLLIRHWDTIVEKVPLLGKAFDVVKAAVSAAIGFLAEYVITRIQGIIGAVENLITIFKNIVSLFVNIVQGDWAGAWDNLKNIASTAIDLVVNMTRALFGQIPEIILGIVLQAVDYVREHFGKLPGIVTDFFGQVLSTITNIGSQIVNAVISFLTFLVQQWIFFYIQLPLLILQYFTEILGHIVNFTGQILTTVITWLTNIVNNFITFLSQLPTLVLDYFTQTFNNIVNLGTQILNFIITNLTQIIDNFISFYGRLPGIALDFFGQMVQAIRDQIGAAIGATDELARGVINKTVEILRELRQAGIDGISALIDGIMSMGGNLLNSVTNFINDNIPGAVKKLLGIGSPSRVMFGIGVNIVEGIINGIKKVLPSLASAAAAAKGVVWNALSGVGGAVTDAAGRALDAAGNVIRGIDGALTGLFGGGGGSGGGISGNVESWRALVAKHFPPNQVDNALRIIQAESGGQAGVVSPPNFNGTRDVGLFQINDVHGLSIGARQDPETNVAFAAQLFRSSGWKPWSTAPKLGLAASGANVSANSPWIVGERGWELFVPNQSGQILSHDDSVNAMGKSGMNVNLYNSTIYARDEADAQRGAGDMAWAIRLRVAGVQV